MPRPWPPQRLCSQRLMRIGRCRPSAPADAILDRALAFHTAGMAARAAARLRARVRRSPAWAARYGYSLGYLEGRADRRSDNGETGR